MHAAAAQRCRAHNATQPRSKQARTAAAAVAAAAAAKAVALLRWSRAGVDEEGAAGAVAARQRLCRARLHAQCALPAAALETPRPHVHSTARRAAAADYTEMNAAAPWKEQQLLEHDQTNVDPNHNPLLAKHGPRRVHNQHCDLAHDHADTPGRRQVRTGPPLASEKVT